MSEKMLFEKTLFEKTWSGTRMAEERMLRLTNAITIPWIVAWGVRCGGGQSLASDGFQQEQLAESSWVQRGADDVAAPLFPIRPLGQNVVLMAARPDGGGMNGIDDQTPP